MVRGTAAQMGGGDGIVILRSGSADLSAGTIDIPATTSEAPRAAVRAPAPVVNVPRSAIATPTDSKKEAEVDENRPSYLDQPLNQQASYLKAQDELRGMIDGCEAMCRVMQKPDSILPGQSERWMLQLKEMENRMVYRANSFNVVFEGKSYRGMAGLERTTIALLRTRRFVLALAEPNNPLYSFSATGDNTFSASLKYWIERGLPALRAGIR